MSQELPWISFHAPWKSRAKSGLVVLAQLERFLAAAALDPAPDSATLSVHEALGAEHARRTRNLPTTPENAAAALAALDYQPGAIVEAATRRFGPGVHRPWASGSTGFLFRWEWERRTPPIDVPALVDFYREHEGLPAVDEQPQVDLLLSYWFELKRPGTSTPLFSGTTLRSSLMLWLGSRRVNLSVRYDAAEFTPELRAIHDELVATLGPKPPRHALQLIIPSPRPGGRERRVPLT